MKIDVIISNPPYQEETEAGSIITRKKPIYQDFVLYSIQNSRQFVCTIIPSRWTMNRSGLELLYNKLSEHSDEVRAITDYMDWNTPVFGGNVQIAGGVMYILLDKKYKGKCIYKNINLTDENIGKRKLIFQPAFIRNNRLVSICHKVQRLSDRHLCDMCRTNTFGLESYQRGSGNGELKLLTSSGWFNIQREEIGSGINSINKFKLALSGTTPGGGASSINGDYKVLASMYILEPEQVCTNTYITIGDFDTYEEVAGLAEYLKTKLIRALILATISSMHIVPYSFTHVPFPSKGFCREWNDAKLYEMYQLNNKEIAYIERIIKTWES